MLITHDGMHYSVRDWRLQALPQRLPPPELPKSICARLMGAVRGPLKFWLSSVAGCAWISVDGLEERTEEYSAMRDRRQPSFVRWTCS